MWAHGFSNKTCNFVPLKSKKENFLIYRELEIFNLFYCKKKKKYQRTLFKLALREGMLENLKNKDKTKKGKTKQK